MGERDLRSEKVANRINQHCYPVFVISYLQDFDVEGGALLANYFIINSLLIHIYHVIINNSEAINYEFHRRGCEYFPTGEHGSRGAISRH